MVHVWVEEMLEGLQAQKGVSNVTVSCYKKDLEDFYNFLQKIKKSYQDVKHDDIVQYMQSLTDLHISDATKARRLTSIRQLYSFAFREGLINEVPTTNIKGSSRQGQLPDILSIDEICTLIERAILESCDWQDYKSVRMLCMFEMLYSTGMRVSEMVSLHVFPFRSNPNMVSIVGKGGKERIVPIGSSASKVIAIWIRMRDEYCFKHCKNGLKHSIFLFPSSGKKGHITREYFFMILKGLAGRAGLPVDKVSPHRIRHTIATHLLQNGMDLAVIQSILGHADISSTQIYTHVSNDRLRDVVFEKHPLARKLPVSE